MIVVPIVVTFAYVLTNITAGNRVGDEEEKEQDKDKERDEDGGIEPELDSGLISR